MTLDNIASILTIILLLIFIGVVFGITSNILRKQKRQRAECPICTARREQ